jgi:hypothetical protein
LMAKSFLTFVSISRIYIFSTSHEVLRLPWYF